MRSIPLRGVLVIALGVTMGVGCVDGDRASALAPELAATRGAEALAFDDTPEFDPARFATNVTHPCFPLTPGMAWRYEAETDDGREVVEVSVLAETKPILGITATVVRDRVILDGALIEDTFDWYAQDLDGNVWYLGEDTKEYENGEVVSTAGSWEAGVSGAEAGIIMLADPKPGRAYMQENAPGVAEDRARVLGRGGMVTVPYGRFAVCVHTYETTPLDKSSREDKYYAEGIGLVLVESRSGDREELVAFTRP